MLEEHGISTVVVFLLADVAARIKAPRGVIVHWPFGHPLGEPGNLPQHMTIIRHALQTLVSAQQPGTLLTLPYRWRRETWSIPDDWSFAQHG